MSQWGLFLVQGKRDEIWFIVDVSYFVLGDVQVLFGLWSETFSYSLWLIVFPAHSPARCRMDESYLKRELNVMYAKIYYEGKCQTYLLNFLHQRSEWEHATAVQRGMSARDEPRFHCSCQAHTLCPQENKNICQEYNWLSRLAALVSVAIVKDFVGGDLCFSFPSQSLKSW